MKQTPILIIGAGPTGMISALCLAKLGVSTTIVERNGGVNEHPKAHELSTRSIEILNMLGITSEELQTEASPYSDGSRFLFGKTVNEEYGRIDLYDDENRRKKYQKHLKADPPYLNISQTALEKIILHHIDRNPLVKLLYNHQWESLKETNKGVENTILNRKTQETFTINSQYVLAADGAGSRCRKFLGIDVEGPDKIQDFVSAYFEMNLRDVIDTPAKLYWIFHPDAPGIFVAHHIEKRWVYMRPIYLEYEKKEKFTEEFLKDKIRLALGKPDFHVEIKSTGFWRMTSQVAQSFQKGKVFLVGDAAHRFPPTGGLGMNTGIADAHNISWKLHAVLQGSANPSILDTYEQERKPVAEQNGNESLHNYHKIIEVIEAFGLSGNGQKMLVRIENMLQWLPSGLRNRILRFLTNIGHRKLDKFHKDLILQRKIKAAIADQIGHFDRIGLDIGYSYEAGAIVPDGTPLVEPEDKVTQYIPSTRPGIRFPHLDFGDKGSSHDLLDYRKFVLLTRTKGNDWKKAAKTIQATFNINIKTVVLEELDLRSDIFQELLDYCEIEETGAILIRPDDHVAFRAKELNGDATNILQQAFEQILKKKNEQNNKKNGHSTSDNRSYPSRIRNVSQPRITQ